MDLPDERETALDSMAQELKHRSQSKVFLIDVPPSQVQASNLDSQCAQLI